MLQALISVSLRPQLEFWGGIKALPWVIKPVYGLLSDAVPLFGYHRRSYLILFSLMGEQNFLQLPPWIHEECSLRHVWTLQYSNCCFTGCMAPQFLQLCYRRHDPQRTGAVVSFIPSTKTCTCEVSVLRMLISTMKYSYSLCSGVSSVQVSASGWASPGCRTHPRP